MDFDPNYDDFNDFHYEDSDCEYNEDMDGDHESALASAGFGTDEDYGYYGEPDDTPMYEDYYGGE
jgi:hypothetical protein